MAAQLPGSVDTLPSSSDSPALEKEYLSTLREASRTLFAQTPQASGLRNQARLQLTSSTLGSDGRPSPLTVVQQQQQDAAFPGQQNGTGQERALDLSRSTLGVSATIACSNHWMFFGMGPCLSVEPQTSSSEIGDRPNVGLELQEINGAGRKGVWLNGAHVFAFYLA